ncbi:leucine rich repeat protein [Bacteriovorax sp. BSW11_IV]|uniref:leucine-rich repeat domain-containing protein n=1 Tax=Bacteriovorax sp. BSW11_IV TaxID=1353529 RepID=UPI00038A1D71|nr:leucine-rich repeat domain-containing protein [Bacteriovorax sp. BSW11_IV]EQC46431.1 leucine rich repeat protein [Bacteriovorax sp. BSW11_IV]
MNQLISLKLKKNEAPSEELLLNTLGVEFISKSSNDRITSLPEHLKKVIFNIVDFNFQKEILINCHNLEYLRITCANCPLLELPVLSQLKTLIVSKSKINDLDKSVYTLEKLEVLDLSGNQLTELFPVAHLPNLRRINLDGNKLEALPEWIYELENLNHLSLDENPLTDFTKQKLYDRFKIVF